MKNLFNRMFFLLVVLMVSTGFVNAQKSKKPVHKTQSPSKSKNISAEQSTAGHNSLLSVLELAVVAEINDARTNPQKYIGYLEEYKKAMKGNILSLPNQTGIVMIEGGAVIDDAINDVKKFAKTPSLIVSDGVFKAANLQLSDLKQNLNLSHKGKDGSDVEMRLFKFGIPGINIAENICYKVSEAREVVMAMILDDGVKSRSHRKNVFSPKFKKIGVACGVSDTKDSVCVTVFTDAFKDKN